jgi:hypothetical protein
VTSSLGTALALTRVSVLPVTRGFPQEVLDTKTRGLGLAGRQSRA